LGREGADRGGVLGGQVFLLVRILEDVVELDPGLGIARLVGNEKFQGSEMR
jgi:hypothetical protein